jgi:hypothetical protein
MTADGMVSILQPIRRARNGGAVEFDEGAIFAWA